MMRFNQNQNKTEGIILLKTSKRYQIFNDLLNALDVGCQLIKEYDAMPHQYGTETLYQVESHVIQMIGKNPSITITMLANAMNKTPSACSQMVKKLKQKNWVKQVRNKNNNCEYNLELTQHGWIVFENHEKLDQACADRNFRNLKNFTDEQLQTYIDIQEHINNSFRKDVEDSRNQLSQMKKTEE